MSRESRWDSRTTANDARERGSQLRGRISGTPPNPARSTSSGSNPRLPQAASNASGPSGSGWSPIGGANDGAGGDLEAIMTALETRYAGRITALEQNLKEKDNAEALNDQRMINEKDAEEKRIERIELALQTLEERCKKAESRAAAAELERDTLQRVHDDSMNRLLMQNAGRVTQVELEELVERGVKDFVNARVGPLLEEIKKLRAETTKVHQDLDARFRKTLTEASATLDQQRAGAFWESENRQQAWTSNAIAQAISKSEETFYEARGRTTNQLFSEFLGGAVRSDQFKSEILDIVKEANIVKEHAATPVSDPRLNLVPLGKNKRAREEEEVVKRDSAAIEKMHREMVQLQAVSKELRSGLSGAMTTIKEGKKEAETTTGELAERIELLDGAFTNLEGVCAEFRGHFATTHAQFMKLDDFVRNLTKELDANKLSNESRCDQAIKSSDAFLRLYKANLTRGAEKKFQEISHFTSRQLVLHMRSEEMKHYLISIMAEILEGHVDEKLDAIDDRLTAHGENHEIRLDALETADDAARVQRIDLDNLFATVATTQTALIRESTELIERMDKLDKRTSSLRVVEEAAIEAGDVEMTVEPAEEGLEAV